MSHWSSKHNYFIILSGFTVLLISFFDNIILPESLHSLKGRFALSTLVYFLSIFIVNSLVQFLLLYLIIKNRLSIRRSVSQHVYHLLIIVTIVFLVSIFSILVVNLLLDNSYSLFAFRLIALYDFVASTVIIMVLLVKLAHWIRRRRNLYEYLYFAAFCMFTITLISAAYNTVEELKGRSITITPFPDPWDNFTSRVNFDLYRNSFLVSFGLFWVATSFLLVNYFSKNNSSKIVRWKYWILVILPLVYYITALDLVSNPIQNLLYSQYPDFSEALSEFWGLAKQVGGFFFALTFIFMSRSVNIINLKFYLQVTGIGIMMLYSSIQINTILILPYPPFGLVTLSTLPISSFLVLIGLFYSAKVLSYDKKLLLELKKHVSKESHSFLNSIGSAEWNKNLEMTVKKALKQIGSDEDEKEQALEADDLKDYVLEVIKEIKKDKNSSP